MSEGHEHDQDAAKPKNTKAVTDNSETGVEYG